MRLVILVLLFNAISIGQGSRGNFRRVNADTIQSYTPSMLLQLDGFGNGDGIALRRNNTIKLTIDSSHINLYTAYLKFNDIQGSNTGNYVESADDQNLILRSGYGNASMSLGDGHAGFDCPVYVENIFSTVANARIQLSDGLIAFLIYNREMIELEDSAQGFMLNNIPIQIQGDNEPVKIYNHYNGVDETLVGFDHRIYAPQGLLANNITLTYPVDTYSGGTGSHTFTPGFLKASGTNPFTTVTLTDTISKAYSWGALAVVDSMITWEVPDNNITLFEIRAMRTGGTSASINCKRTRSGSSVDLLSTNYSTTTSLTDAGTEQNTSLQRGDIIRACIRSISGTTIEIYIQLNFTKAR